MFGLGVGLIAVGFVIVALAQRKERREASHDFKRKLSVDERRCALAEKAQAAQDKAADRPAALKGEGRAGDGETVEADARKAPKGKKGR